MNLSRTLLISIISTFPLLFINCGLLDELVTTEEPTYERMQAIWKVTEAKNEFGDDILGKINFPVTVFDLQTSNALNSTAGPMATYMVYGANAYTNVATKIDQVFDYSKLDIDDGEWFISDGVTSRFTLLLKLESVPGLTSLTTLLSWFGVYTPILRETIYYKFKNVKVTFDTDDVMVWEFDNETTTEYYTVDEQGDKRLITLSTDSFSHCRFVLTKQVDGVVDIIKKASNLQN